MDNFSWTDRRGVSVVRVGSTASWMDNFSGTDVVSVLCEWGRQKVGWTTCLWTDRRSVNRPVL